MAQMNFDAERSAAMATLDMLEEASSPQDRGAMVFDLTALRTIIDRGLLALRVVGALRDVFQRISSDPEMKPIVDLLTKVVSSKEEPQPPKTVEGEAWQPE